MTKKEQFMEKNSANEQAYYAHATKVCAKRHHNIRTGQLLKYYNFDVVDFFRKNVRYDIPAYVMPQEYMQWLTTDCKCPITLMQEYVKWHGNDDDHTKWGYISALLRKFPKSSFLRFGDSKQVDEKFYRVYCSEQGTPIDIQAMEISEMFGQEITEEEICEFTYAHPKGTNSYRFVTNAERIKSAYEKLTDYTLNFEFARSLVKALSGEGELENEDCPF